MGWEAFAPVLSVVGATGPTPGLSVLDSDPNGNMLYTPRSEPVIRTVRSEGYW